MFLHDLLDRSAALEERASRLYGRFAAAAPPDGELARFWSGLAAEEMAHARSVRAVRSRMPDAAGRRVRVDGWAEALGEIEACLGRAEALAAAADIDRQLAAALSLEATELDPLRHAALDAATAPPHTDGDHATRIAETALRLSSDPQVQLQATRLLAQARLAHR